MGHTLPPFTNQFKVERARFTAFRRALLLAEDKRLFSNLWNRAEFHVPAAEKASHPLPISTILMMVNLEQEKSISKLENQSAAHEQRIREMEESLKRKELQITYLTRELKVAEKNMEQRLKMFREEILDIKYQYVP